MFLCIHIQMVLRLKAMCQCTQVHIGNITNSQSIGTHTVDTHCQGYIPVYTHTNETTPEAVFLCTQIQIILQSVPMKSHTDGAYPEDSVPIKSHTDGASHEDSVPMKSHADSA